MTRIRIKDRGRDSPQQSAMAFVCCPSLFRVLRVSEVNVAFVFVVAFMPEPYPCQIRVNPWLLCLVFLRVLRASVVNVAFVFVVAFMPKSDPCRSA